MEEKTVESVVGRMEENTEGNADCIWCSQQTVPTDKQFQQVGLDLQQCLLHQDFLKVRQSH